MMRIGIDLGTTFCCVAYIDHIGEPHVIPNAEGGRTTPSVIWFNGTTAIVGAKAEAKKGERNTDPSNIVQFVKRNMGAPIDSVPGSDVTPYPYDLWNGGFKYGPEGMSAIILRKLKLDAIDYFKQKETIEPGLAEDDTSVEAVITVPAYFNDLQRKKTKLAGYAAGLSVQAIINEPTAAALSYPFTDGPGRKRIMVFDLGGGTFDVTILEYDGQNYTVITSDGHHQLGGKDFDALIMEHLRETFVASTGRKVPIERAFEIQTIALDAKFALTEKHEVTATITADGETAYAVLDRADPAGTDDILITDPDALPPFYFESRATNLLSACRSVCERTLRRSGLRWDQINEIVLAGGSCRMPMIPKMLEEISRQVIRPMIPGFDYDTAIAIGAAKFGRMGRTEVVRDVVSRSIGVKCVVDGREIIDHLLRKDASLPAKAEEYYDAEPGACLEVFEGESSLPRECVARGVLRLPEIEGRVKVSLELDEDNTLTAVADYPPDRREMTFESDDRDNDRRKELRERVHAIEIQR